MKVLLADPVVLICSGIFLVGLFALFWAIGKFLGLKSSPKNAGGYDDLPAVSDLSNLGMGSSPIPSFGSASPPAPAVSREVADRLENMTRRLEEMQAALTKQSPAGAAGQAGAVGQGFSPETIDKLLKIIGNVIQQVDILQKSLNPAKEASGAKVEPSASPFTKI